MSIFSIIFNFLRIIGVIILYRSSSLCIIFIYRPFVYLILPSYSNMMRNASRGIYRPFIFADSRKHTK
jgi:hypothetical protein